MAPKSVPYKPQAAKHKQNQLQPHRQQTPLADKPFVPASSSVEQNTTHGSQWTKNNK
jgi:hypothetical protein